MFCLQGCHNREKRTKTPGEAALLRSEPAASLLPFPSKTIIIVIIVMVIIITTTITTLTTTIIIKDILEYIWNILHLYYIFYIVFVIIIIFINIIIIIIIQMCKKLSWFFLSPPTKPYFRVTLSPHKTLFQSHSLQRGVQRNESFAFWR